MFISQAEANKLYKEVKEAVESPLARGSSSQEAALIQMYVRQCEVIPVDEKKRNKFLKQKGNPQLSTGMTQSVNNLISIGSLGSVWVDSPFGRICYERGFWQMV